MATEPIQLTAEQIRLIEKANPAFRERHVESSRPGELIHVDIKKLGRIDGIGHRITGDRTTKSRGTGWDFLHVCIDDASRLAFTRVLPDERKESAVLFLGQALAWFKDLGVTVERVMTDNGSAYRSHQFAEAIADAGLKHKRTRPYTPRTNGLSALPTSLRGIGPWPMAERFIQTMLREWAYAIPFPSSDRRAADLPRWLAFYNAASQRPSVYVVEAKRLC